MTGRVIIAPMLAVLTAACMSADSGRADPSSAGAQAVDCPVIESRDWIAWIDAQPGPEARRRLHVQGAVDLPTPGFEIAWTLGPADRRAVPSQIVEIAFTPPDGMVIQMVSTERVSFETDAIYPRYASIKIRCGGRILAEIDEIDEVF